MRNTLKVGLVVLVVAALATTGMAFALDDGDETPPAPPGRITEVLAPLVEDGTLTQAQADAVAEVLAERAGELRGRHGAHLEEIAEFLGITSEELRAALQEGSTLGEVAEANGSGADELIGFLVDQASERLDEALADGRITEDEAAERLAEITERITRGVTEGFEQGPGFGHGPACGHHRGFGRPFGGGPLGGGAPQSGDGA
jgi:polyhydroxyalkanoate synthesis regulator phasin